MTDGIARIARLGCALLLAAALPAQSPAQGKRVQYVFKGQCNGLIHWVSVLHDRDENVVSTVIIRAKCPYHETQTFRIFRNISIPVNLGGRYSDIIKQSGIDYYIDGNILSSQRATLRHQGPKTTLTCGTPDIVGPVLKAEICRRFSLRAREADEP